MYTREEYLKRIDNNRIRISDLKRYCVKKWKLFLLLFFVSFLICMAFILSVYRREPVAPEPLEMDDLTEEQKERVDSALKLYQELENINMYKNESAYMKLNAFDCNITTLQYLIAPEDSSARAELYELYTNFIKNGKLKTVLEEKLGERMKYPADLVTLDEQKIMKTFPVSNEHVLCIKIVSEERKGSEEIAEIVNQAVGDYQTELAGRFEKHSLKLVSQDSYQGADYDVRDNQDDIIDQCEEKRRQLVYLEDLLSVEEKTVLTAEKDGTVGQEAVVLKSSNFSWIFVFIALFAGVIIAGGFIVIYYIYSNKVKFQREIVDLFDIPLLGEISEKMDSEKKEDFGKELELYCSGLENKAVFLSSLDDNEQKKLEPIKMFLEKRGITLILGGDICGSSQAVEEAATCKNLILTYQLDKTTYHELDSVIQKCCCYGIHVVGAICKGV